jgi:DNA polymerase-3 subunit alpha
VFEKVVDRVATDKKNQSNGQISLFETVLKDEENLTTVTYPNLPELLENVKLKYEKEIVGVYVSGHPLDKHIDKFKYFNFSSNMIEKKEFTDSDEEDLTPNYVAEEDDENVEESPLKDGMEVTFGGIVSEIKKTYTKRDNKEMGIIKVEDLYGTVEIMMFPKIYAQFKKDLEIDVMATFKGKVSVREDQNTVILLDKMEKWNDDNQEEEKPKQKFKTLFLKFDTSNEVLMDKIEDVLDSYKGEDRVVIRDSVTNGVFKLNKTVKADNLLEYELYNYIPEQFVKIGE